VTSQDDELAPIPLIEEAVRIDKKEVVTGHVRVRTVTEEIDQIVAQDLESETVEISRVPANREVAEAPAIRQEGDVTIISLVEEIIVVTKRLVVTEEVHIRRIKSTDRVETSISLRKQHAIVERTDAENDSPATPTHGDEK
jgi:uncharacterized protein (TIGR02271 family)